ncbi:hypothetical protein L6452_37286 [Arctium lappa]|uniref:Uncharacterized protein n=1 Tax=Arctium lappa TaxID=4217 RepID=A0ACB8Y320_ARCLA|nr:hypothetical protein L6452_37286 [Arctium lappa]
MYLMLLFGGRGPFSFWGTRNWQDRLFWSCGGWRNDWNTWRENFRTGDSLGEAMGGNHSGLVWLNGVGVGVGSGSIGTISGSSEGTRD